MDTEINSGRLKTGLRARGPSPQRDLTLATTLTLVRPTNLTPTPTLNLAHTPQPDGRASEAHLLRDPTFERGEERR